MPTVRTRERGHHCRNGTSEDTWKIDFTRVSGREGERLASGRELSVDAWLVSARVDSQKSLVGHLDTDQSVKDERRHPVVEPQTLVAKPSRNVCRA
jgi:hypothetical protein